MTARDTVLVTGASGFVGSAVARLLAARGFDVRVLIRSSSPRANLEGYAHSIVEGDMRNPADMRAATTGARYLFHVAADYRLWAKDPEEIVRNNLNGTRTVMEAARDAGVERVVYTSSVATLKPGTPGAPSGESERLNPGGAIGAYKRSKVVAERLVEDMVADGLPAVIVNPSTPIGPRDIKPTPTGRIIVEAASGRVPAFVDTGLNLVHVDDVAEGHLLAFEKGRIGDSYILGGENVSLKEMLACHSRSCRPQAAAGEAVAHAAVPARARRRGRRAVDRQGTVSDRGCAQNERASHVLQLDESADGVGLPRAPVPPGSGRCARLVSCRRLCAMIWVALMPILIWIYMLLGRGMFWRMRERDDRDEPRETPHSWPSITAVVPARNEADVIAATLGSLLQQDYPGSFRIVLVDDQSEDGTSETALTRIHELGGDPRVAIVAGRPRPPGWTGKLWAMQQGLEYALQQEAPDYLLFTDADISHAPDNLRHLVIRAQDGHLVLVSLMAKLYCRSLAEKLLIPAFVFFFDMLFPFGWANDPSRRTAAAAGGCMLARREPLLAAGGIDAIKARTSSTIARLPAS